MYNIIGCRTDKKKRRRDKDSNIIGVNAGSQKHSAH
jgi:hypothetical protein